MIVKDYILNFDKQELYNALCGLFENCCEVITAGRVQFYKFIKDIEKIKPVLSDGVICARLVSDEGDLDVFLKEPDNENRYSLLYIGRAEILGYSVDEDSIALCGRLNYAAHLIWEMTWFGFRNEDAVKEDFDN